MKDSSSIGSLLPRFSVTRPVSVIMILLAVVVVGAISYQRIPIALFPEGLESRTINIYIPYPNASPRDVEETITRKVEDIVGTVPNIQRLTSYSSNGSANVRIEFRGGTDLNAAYFALRDRMDRVRPDLPDDVDRIYVRKSDQNESAVVELVVTLPTTVEDAYHRIDQFVRPALQRIEGVGSVDSWGIQRRELQIELDEDRLRSHGIDLAQMVNQLRNQNLTLSGGYVHDGGRKIYVRSLGRFTGPGEIQDAIIDRERRLRVSDVARVSLQQSRREWVYRVDGKPAIGLEIMRESTGNIEHISRDVRGAIEQLKRSPELSGATFDIFWDQGQHVRESIDNLKTSGLWGGFFAALVMYAFLRAPRMTGILTLAIPLSLLCTIVVLFFMGWSLNIATMMGLLLSVGMVIDNAIVIVENIYRRRQEGEDATTASIVGAGEVGLAVVTATLTSVVVFLPLILMGGGVEFTFWMARIGVPVIASLLASLFIALIFVPLAAQRLSRGHQHVDLQVVTWARTHYLEALRWVLTHRLSAALLVLLALSTLPFAFGRIERSQGGGGGGDRKVRFNFELPSGFSLTEADAFFKRVEVFLLAESDRYGFDRVEARFRNNAGRLQGRLRPNPNNQWYESTWDELMLAMGRRTPPMDQSAIETDFRARFELPPGITLRTTQRNQTVSDDSVLSLSLYGEDTATLMALAEETVWRLRAIPGLLSVETDVERGNQEFQILVDRDRARRLGLNPQAISSTISQTVRGLEVGRHYTGDGRELPIRLLLGDVDSQRLDDVRSMTFRTDTGIEVPLEAVATVNITRTLGQIRRENRETMLAVTARVPRVDARRLFDSIDKVMAGFEMPRGYRWDKGQRHFQMRDSDQAHQFALGLSVLFVFLLMGVLFESFVLPLAVIIAVPFSFLGVYWTLYLTSTPMNNMAMIGSVILVGVVVNNAIVLVDLTNRLRLEGRERFAALMEAGHHRFRPILMTTFTTIFGLIPMALGNSRMMDMPYAPLGRTMIGGLLASTVLTLVIVPLCYTLLDDLRLYTGRIMQSVFAPAGTAETTPPAIATRDV